MIQYAVIVSLIAAASIGGFVLYARHARGKMQRLEADKRQAVSANRQLRKEIQQREHIISRMQEVESEAQKTKREIRDHDNPGDRADAATRVMRDLSRGGDENGDGGSRS